MSYPGKKIPHLCQVCGKQLMRHERPEQFCDKCLRAAQAEPILKSDKERGIT